VITAAVQTHTSAEELANLKTTVIFIGIHLQIVYRDFCSVSLFHGFLPNFTSDIIFRNFLFILCPRNRAQFCNTFTVCFYNSFSKLVCSSRHFDLSSYKYFLLRLLTVLYIGLNAISMLRGNPTCYVKLRGEDLSGY